MILRSEEIFNVSNKRKDRDRNILNNDPPPQMDLFGH